MNVLFMFILFLNFYIIDSSGRKYTIRVDKFGQCPSVANLPMTLHNTTIRHINDSFVSMDINITVTEEIPTDLENVWEMNVCDSKETLDTCKPFHKLRAPNYCKMISMKGDWSSFLNCFKPRYQCPFHKGLYEGKQCNIDMSTFKLVTFQEAYWKFKIEIRSTRTKKVYTCMDVAMQFRFIRN